MTYETKDSGARTNLANGMVRDVETGKADWTLLLKGPMLVRWRELLERGAKKYGRHNWTLALEATDRKALAETLDRFERSAFRHMMQWLAGDRDEDHASAVFFNINGAEGCRAQLERLDAQPAPIAIPDNKGPTFDPLDTLVLCSAGWNAKARSLVSCGCPTCKSDLRLAGFDETGKRAVPL